MAEISEKNLKTDILIISSVVVIGLILAAVFCLTQKPGGQVVVSVDGKEAARYDLSENVDTRIQGIGGENRLIIQNGEAWIEEADCPDKLCVKQGHVSKTNESIVCLPHRMTVRVVGDSGEAAPDAVVSEVRSDEPRPDRTMSCQPVVLYAPRREVRS